MAWCVKRFHEEIDLFLRHSNHINDSWTCKEQILPNGCLKYLEKRHVWKTCRLKLDTSTPKSTELESSFDIRMDYWIIFSISYQKPILYFMAYDQEHSPLTFKQIMTIIPDHFRQMVDHLDVTTIISLGQHPISHRACWYIHPCDTQGLLDLVFRNSHPNISWIACWFSLIGSIIGGHLDNSYACCSRCGIGSLGSSS